MPCPPPQLPEQVYGTDYPTRDGTALRDYIHVMDLVRGGGRERWREQHGGRGGWWLLQDVGGFAAAASPRSATLVLLRCPVQAEGHVAALRRLFAAPDLACKPINLGTGTGQTVMEVGWQRQWGMPGAMRCACLTSVPGP